MSFPENLPYELLVQIVSELPRQDLHSVSRVCRRLRDISLPLIYKEPYLMNNRVSKPLQDFLRTMLTPSCELLVTHVRRLTIDWNDDTVWDDRQDPVLAAARSRFGIGDYRQCECEHVFLLLHLLPRLHILTIFTPLDSFKHFLRLLYPLQEIDALPIGFQNLRHFTGNKFDPSGMALFTLLRLPHIQSIAISTMGLLLFSPEECTITEAAAGTSSLERLTLTSGPVLPRWLEYILQVPRRLKHFSYNSRLYHSVPWDNFVGLGLALLPLQHSLTTLTLDFFNRQRDDNLLPTGTIGSLREWQELRTVKCGLRLLIERGSPHGLASVLPRGIHELEILDDLSTPVEAAAKQVMDLLLVKEMVPLLETVRVYTSRRKSSGLMKRLRMSCQAVGVAFEDGLRFSCS